MSPDVIGLLILGVCVLLFLTDWIPSTATAVLGCLLFVMTGVSSFSSAFSGFSNSTVILVFCLLTLGMAMENSGLAYTLGKLILKFAYNERVFVVAAILVSGALSMFMANTAVIAIFLAITTSVVNSSDNMRLKNVCLPVCMGAMFGGVCTLIGSTPQLMVQSITEEYAGVSYKMFDYMPVGLCLLGAFILYYLFVGYPLSRKLWKPEDDVTDTEKLKKITDNAALHQGSKKDQIIVVCILLLMCVLFITELVSTVMTALITMFLLLFTGQIKEKQVLRNMDWAVLIRLAGCLGIASGLADAGSGELIAGAFTSVFGSIMTPRLLLAAMVILTMIISNFITNSTAVFVVLPSILMIAVGLGYNPTPYGIACCYAANLCFATPLANAQTAITMVAGYKFGDYFKYNGLLELIVAVLIILLVPVFFPF